MSFNEISLTDLLPKRIKLNLTDEAHIILKTRVDFTLEEQATLQGYIADIQEYSGKGGKVARAKNEQARLTVLTKFQGVVRDFLTFLAFEGGELAQQLSLGQMQAILQHWLAVDKESRAEKKA